MLHSVFYAIVFLLTLVISNILNKVFPRIPLPIIQVTAGIILGIFGAENIIEVNPEVFLAFIIAPLLFREAEEADVKSILKHTSIILMLIFPLVFITALGIGFLTHSFYSVVPLAAAFALGGALAPTDAVAVSSLSTRLSFPDRILNILKGEGLLNDASGLIAFQIALTALTTGYFSIINASLDLALAAAGGILVGSVLHSLKNLILTILEDVAAQDTPGYLLIELTMPLAAFLIADEFHFSGIIAVVIAGVMSANDLRRTTLFDAQVTRLQSTIWETLTFILNAVVFIFLGIELHNFVWPLIIGSAYDTVWLIFIALALTLALFFIRFVILGLYYLLRGWRRHQDLSVYFSDVLILTFSGSKGTVSLAAILLLPASATSTYSLLIFLCIAVTILSFLAGSLILPFLTGKKSDHIDNMVRISLLADVVTELNKDLAQVSESEQKAYAMTIDTYQERMQVLIIEQESSSRDYNELKLLIMRIETEGLEDALRQDQISIYTYRTYARYLRSLEQSIVYQLVSTVQMFFVNTGRVFRYLIARLLRIDFTAKTNLAEQEKQTRDEITNLYFSNTELVLQALENLEGVYDARLIDFLQSNHLRTAERVADGVHMTRLLHRYYPVNLRQMMRGYYLERKLIFEYELDNRLSPEEAHKMRRNVNTMEDYSMNSSNQNQSRLSDLFSKRKEESIS